MYQNLSNPIICKQRRADKTWATCYCCGKRPGTVGHPQTLMHWTPLSCWCGGLLPTAVSDVCSNRQCFTICHHFNTRRSAAANCVEDGGGWPGSPFIRRVRRWKAADYTCRWQLFISLIPHAAYMSGHLYRLDVYGDLKKLKILVMVLHCCVVGLVPSSNNLLNVSSHSTFPFTLNCPV